LWEAIKDKINVHVNFKAKVLKLWKVEISGDHDHLANLSLQDQDELLVIRKISKYFHDTLAKDVFMS
jgi:hypothetical protein